MLEMTTKMILEMLLHRNEIQKRIFQTQSDCATFEMKTDPTEPFSSLPPQFIFNKFCSLGVSWEVAVWRRNDKLIMNSISLTESDTYKGHNYADPDKVESIFDIC